MLTCPRCATELVSQRGAHGILFGCARCKGALATMPVLRRRLEPDAVNALWRRARATAHHVGCLCPSCRRPMIEVAVQRDAREVIVDACEPCQSVWFDFDELEAMPERPVPAPPAPRSQAEIEAAKEIAKARVEPEAVEVVRAEDVATTDWLHVPTLRAIDVPDGRPWVTWTLVFAFAVVGLACEGTAMAASGIDGFGTGFHRAAAGYGFLVSAPWRHGGLTWITSFFLHRDWIDLVVDSFVLAMLGNAFELLVGRGRFATTLAAGAFVGTFAFWIAKAWPDDLLVGAAPALAGLFVYAAILFPRAKIRIPFVWYVTRGVAGVRVTVPLLGAVVVWFAVELLGMLRPRSGNAAEIGGALAGAALAWFDRRRTVSSGGKGESTPRLS